MVFLPAGAAGSAAGAVATALLGALLIGCAAKAPPLTTGPAAADDPVVVVYRVSQVGGTMGSWVATRLEINGKVVGRIADRSYLSFIVPAGAATLSATDMVDLRYPDAERMTLRTELVRSETAYFRLVSVYGPSCAAVHAKADGSAVASVTHRFRPDSAQTTCLQRVPAELALKALEALRKAD